MRMSEPKKVALYLRKSRADVEAESRGEGETLKKHRQSLFELAHRNNYSIVDLYEELHSGELISDRPQMQRLLRDVSSGQYDAVLCMDLDRLGRGNLIDQGLIQEAFKGSQTLIVTPRKVYDLDDELDEEWSEFESFLARRELKLITRRMHRGRRQSAMQGKFVGKQPPYGYIKEKDLKLCPDPETASIVQMMYSWRAEGIGRNTIARRLQDMRIDPPSGLRWEGVTVRDILSNEVYIGTIIFGKRKFTKDSNGKKHMSIRPRDEWIIVPNAHDPIISLDLWSKVQVVNSAHAPHTKIDFSLKNPLAGVVRCGVCGKCMVRRNHKGHSRAMYICPSYGCPTRTARFEYVEQRLIEQLRMIAHDLPSEDIVVDNEQSERQLQNLNAQLARIQNEFLSAQKQKDNLHDLLEQGIYDVTTFLERSGKVTERISMLTQSVNEIQIQIDQLEEKIQRRTDVLPALSRFVDEYNRITDVNTKNQLLKAVVEEIRYFRRKEWPIDRPFELEVYLRV